VKFESVIIRLIGSQVSFEVFESQPMMQVKIMALSLGMPML
jgi:hypothetical protein